MKKLITLALISILALSLLSAASVGLITGSKGKVTLKRNAQSIKFKIGDNVHNKDEIRTGAESFASFKYVDGVSSIKVFSNSYIEINASTSGKAMEKSATVRSGSMQTKVTPGSKGSMTIKTPATVASVKGTELFTNVNDSQEVRHIILKGIVNVRIPETGESQDVSAGNTAFVDQDLNFEVRETTEEDLASLDQAEQESIRDSMPKTMRIQLIDEQGQIKYIEIIY